MLFVVGDDDEEEDEEDIADAVRVFVFRHLDVSAAVGVVVVAFEQYRKFSNASFRTPILTTYLYTTRQWPLFRDVGIR